jgi:hypothetical protein
MKKPTNLGRHLLAVLLVINFMEIVLDFTKYSIAKFKQSSSKCETLQEV